MMKVYIQASELIMPREEMLQHIPENKLAEISGKGILQAYTLAHEGISQPKILGEKKTPLTWTKAVIRRLAGKLRKGSKFFIEHGVETNSHANRKPVGEIVSSFLKNVGGRLANIVIGHFPNDSEVKNCDVCSMEAKVDTLGNIVNDISEVTGIALGNSNKDHPAFPGAVRLNAIQCFEDSSKKINNEETNMGDIVPKKLGKQDVIDAVRELNIFPYQLYDEAALRNDPTFSKVFAQNAKLEADNEKINKELEEIKKTSAEAIKQSSALGAKDRLNDLMKDGYTDMQKTWINRRFKPDQLEDTTEAGLKQFLDSAKKDFAEEAKLFGITESENQSPDKKPGSDGTGEELSSEDEALKAIGV